ncbi:TauD/TfdA family dioxygenase [Alisedimentitalea sp. MJ-SS2]|uniref:TauD/TfdA family dioxygenase n=1 Tax=Aliisedimentitalea sp. MJ-SS2 TaxID=3049795 RepID=UPI002908CA22|nr:TauD/TfdA family dioxygenase [Alisedimentitalea sp. MJ-SS2]MDU8926189.1 TauD/TfdA family dioxygenase [Alisedimentitalea sp. MJ-SS2]
MSQHPKQKIHVRCNKKEAPMSDKTKANQEFDWANLDSDAGYLAWRATKLSRAEKCLSEAPVALSDLANPSESERKEVIRRCQESNFAVYSAPAETDDSTVRRQLRGFADAFGLRIAEAHRSEGEQGIVALRVSDTPEQRGFIPYTSRGINWHTDGYYNAPDNLISGFVLHCMVQAAEGGTNDILDHEIIYIRLRDAHPEYLRALMHPQAMAIPENVEKDGSVRPVSVGPVFYPDPQTGRMQMRYTARTRSISWRDDPVTLEAEAWLRNYLAKGDPLALRARLQPGQGVLNNNVLHTRTPFENGADTDLTRVMFRVRFHNRVGEI